MALRIVYVVCACGAPVDMVEYDDAGTSRAVADVMAATGMDEAEAKELVGTRNPGAELTGEEQARALADQIIHRNVPGRDPSTYRCLNRHDDQELSVSERRPAPLAPQIVRIPADVASRLSELEEQARKTTGGTGE